MRLCIFSFFMAVGLLSEVSMARGYRLRGEYKLESYKVKDNRIFINLAGIENLPVCGPADKTEKLELIKQTLASADKNIEVTVNEDQGCVTYLDRALTPDEIISSAEKSLKKILGGADISLKSFTKNNFSKLKNGDRTIYVSNRDTSVVFVPYGKAVIKSLSIPWKREPGTDMEFYVSQISSVGNDKSDEGHTKYSQGSDNWDKLAYVENKMDEQALALAKKVDKENKLNLFKNVDDYTRLILLDKPDALILKRIELGSCSQDRVTKILKISKSTKKAVLPLKSEESWGGECPE